MGKKYLVAKLARLIAWAVAGIVGAEASQAETVGMEVAQYIVAIGIALVSFYMSYRHDQKLLQTELPKGGATASK